MAWYPIVGHMIFWIGLITAVIMFAVKRKWYPIAYLIAISTYIFTVAFMIDVHDLNKHFILLLLIFSAALTIFLGLHLAKKFGK